MVRPQVRRSRGGRPRPGDVLAVTVQGPGEAELGALFGLGTVRHEMLSQCVGKSSLFYAVEGALGRLWFQRIGVILAEILRSEDQLKNMYQGLHRANRTEINEILQAL